MYVGDFDPIGVVDLPGELREPAGLPEPRAYRCIVCGGWGFALPEGREICLGCHLDEQEHARNAALSLAAPAA